MSKSFPYNQKNASCGNNSPIYKYLEETQLTDNKWKATSNNKDYIMTNTNFPTYYVSVHYGSTVMRVCGSKLLFKLVHC